MISQTEQILYRLSNLDTQQQKISYQMATKEKLQNGSDDSVLYSKVISLDDKIRSYEGLKIQVEKTSVQNGFADSGLTEIKKIFEFMKKELVKANTSTTTSDAIAAIASSISGLRENLYQISNTQADGEYIFSGSDTSIQPFEKDSKGKITYKGDNQLRKVAVEEGSYRDRGVNGFDMMMYSSSTAYKGETLTFNQTDRIVDQDKNEWKMRTPIAEIGEDFTFPANTSTSTPIKLIDGNNKIWKLNTIDPLFPVLEDDIGNTISVTPPISPSTLYKLDGSDNTSNMGINELVKYNGQGLLVTPEEILVPTVSTSGRQISVPAVDGTKFEAKTNIFDFIDNTINALKKVDSSGNSISDDISKELISNSLTEMDNAYNAVNIAHADLGGKNQVFEISLERISSKLTQYNVLSQEIGAADLTKVAMEAKALELTYTALYSTISKTINYR